jgi:hypothetical protein
LVAGESSGTSVDRSIPCADVLARRGWRLVGLQETTEIAVVTAHAARKRANMMQLRDVIQEIVAIVYNFDVESTLL